MNTPIDLRSDTVTRPSPAMRRAMADAEVGDDVLDGDPTTARLEARVAELLGHEAALFFPSGTQANQTGIALHVRPGEELIVEAEAHLRLYEMGAVSGLWGAQVHPVPTPDGMLSASLVEGAIRTGRYVPRTGAVAVENTHNAAGGAVMPTAALEAIRRAADAHGLPLHLDGARLWNAAAALEVEPSVLTRHASTVMVSFSKGLGCPVGSCLAGSRALMDEAWVIRKRLGGGMRQSGILAAAALYALDHLLSRVGDDHAAARALVEPLEGHPAVRAAQPATNIVMLDLVRHTATEAIEVLAAEGVLVVPFGPRRLRAVTHLDVSAEDARRAGDIMAQVLQ